MKKLLLAVALLLAFPAAFAQTYYPVNDYGVGGGMNHIEFYGGMVLPQQAWRHDGDRIDLGNTGWTAGLLFYRNLTRVVGLGFDGSYAQFGDGDKMNEGAANESFYRTGVATGLLSMRLIAFPRHSTRIYFPFGVGVGHFFTRERFVDGSHKTYDCTNLAGMGGIGLEFDADETVTFGVEGRMYLMSLNNETKDKFGKGHIRYFDIIAKLGFRF